MTLGQNIKVIRELKKIHRRYMANKLGIGMTAYGNIERGSTKKLDPERKKKIADILGVTTEELEQFNSDNVIHNIKNGDNSPIVNNSDNQIYEQQEALIDLHKQTLTVLEKVASALNKAIEKLGN